MAFEEVGSFSHEGKRARIEQDADSDSTTFKVTAGRETITMKGSWDPDTGAFTRTTYFSNTVRCDGDTGEILEVLPGHIRHLGAEALGQLLHQGIIGQYTSSRREDRTRGTDNGLAYLRQGVWKERLEEDVSDPERVTLRRALR